MPLYNDCSGDLNQQMICRIANGQPQNPVIQTGTGSPENVVIGLAVGTHLFWRTDGGGVMYAFNGTVGTSVGWDAI